MMKQLRILILLLVMTGCSRIHFDSAMPRQTTSLKLFNSDLIGKYYYSDSILIVDNKEPIYNSMYFTDLYKSHDSLTLISADIVITDRLVYFDLNLKSYYEISKVDTSRVAANHKKEKKTIEGKYLVFNGFGKDTILNLKKQDKLKYFNGSYYLNHLIAKKDWEIYQVEIKKDNKLSLNLTNEQDEKQITKNDSAKWRPLIYNTVHLSNEQFKEFTEHGGFRTRYGLKKYAH